MNVQLHTGSDEILSRIAAASVLGDPRRFRGRAAVQRLATGGRVQVDLAGVSIRDAALRVLACRTPREREILALRGLPSAILEALDLDCVRERERVRSARRLARAGIPAVPAPGGAVHRLRAQRAAHCEAALEAALAHARFTEATHSHDTTIEYVERGYERASSTTGSVWPSEVGLPNAYSRKGFRVTTSTHKWCVSLAILDVEPDARADRGVVYLSPTCRVRQGRGTSLVTERRKGARGGWRVVVVS